MIRSNCPLCNTKMKSFTRQSSDTTIHVCTNTDCMFTSETIGEAKICPYCYNPGVLRRSSTAEFNATPTKINEVYSLRSNYNKCLKCEKYFTTKSESVSLRMGLTE